MLNRSQNGSTVLQFVPALKADPTTFADTTFLSYAEKTSDDIHFILKKAVIPHLPKVGTLKLREIRILAVLSFFSKPLTPAQISEILCYDPATVTRAVHALVGECMITREDNIRDTRSVLLLLTEKGLTLANAFNDRVKHVFKQLEDKVEHRLTIEEKAAYLDAMAKINRRSKSMRELVARKRWET